MKHPIKIQIKKRRPFGYDWVRFEEVDRLLLDEDSIIKTEAQLCKYMYDRFGAGRYQILAWQKGYEGFWMFWLGDIYENGFCRDIRKNKELDKLKVEHVKAKSYEEKADIEEEMQFEREINKIDRVIKRKGPIIIKTSRPGIMHSYEEL